jgi:hypothetical protein
MTEHPILIHDAHGFTQAMRRERILAICADTRDRLAALGQALTWTEDPDGVTVYVNGVMDCRITYAELAHYEVHLGDVP